MGSRIGLIDPAVREKKVKSAEIRLLTPEIHDTREYNTPRAVLKGQRDGCTTIDGVRILWYDVRVERELGDPNVVMREERHTGSEMGWSRGCRILYPPRNRSMYTFHQKR